MTKEQFEEWFLFFDKLAKFDGYQLRVISDFYTHHTFKTEINRKSAESPVEASPHDDE